MAVRASLFAIYWVLSNGGRSRFALNGHRLLPLSNSDERSLSQALLLVIQLRVFAGKGHHIGGGVVNRSLASPLSIPPCNRYAAARDDLRELVILERNGHVRRVHDHILLLSMNMAGVMNQTVRVIVVQSFRGGAHI